MSFVNLNLSELYRKVESNVQFPWISALGCCTFEVQNAMSSTYDWRRLGVQQQVSDPCEADVMIVAGWINESFKEEILAAYTKLGGRRSVIAVGACAISGAPYSMATKKMILVSDILPVDVFVPGCPPRPEAILDAIRLLKQKILPGPNQTAVLYEALKETPRS